MSDKIEKLTELARRVVDLATASGADVAEVVATSGSELSAKVRMGEPELVEEASSRGLGLRVISAGREATTYTSDMTDAGLAALVADAVELARLSQADEHVKAPAPEELAKAWPELELFDPSSLSVNAEAAIERAIEGESAARAFDPRIDNSEGSTFSREAGAKVLVTSGGFRGGYESSYCSLYVSPVAEDEGGKKQNGYHWSAARFLDDLDDPKSVGEEAARRTLAKLGARKVQTCEAPVIFDPDAGRALLSLFFSCIAGNAIYKRTSYLLDREGDQVTSPLVHIDDDPLIPRGPGSRPFDGEGLPSRTNVVVEAGVLKTYLLDTYCASKLGRQSTASASRGLGGRPQVAPSNFVVRAGERDPAEIIAQMDRGLYVTSMMGFGFNPVTGDFSRGAEGFWVEDGKKSFPVSGITISASFDDLWKRIDAVGSDLELKTRYATPTLRVSKMTIAGT